MGFALEEEIDTPPTLEYILWDPKTFHQRRTTVVPLPKYLHPGQTDSNYTAEIAVRQLALPSFVKRYQEYEGGYEGVIIIIGSSDQLSEMLVQDDAQEDRLPEGVGYIEAIQRLKLMFGRGIAKAALDTHSDEPGVTRIRFDALKALVGNIGNESMDGGAAALYTSGSETDVTKVNPTYGGLPVVVYVVNGGEQELWEVQQCVRAGYPVCAVRGTGGIADALGNAFSDKNIDDHVPEAKVMEIVKDGTFEFVDLKEVDGVIMRDMTKRLFAKGDGDGGAATDETVQLAWELKAVYDANREILSRQNSFLKKSTFQLSVFTTILVALKPSLDDTLLDMEPDVDTKLYRDILTVIVALLPVLIGVLLAIDNRFGFGTRAKILTSASQSLTKEIYIYRALMGDYITAPVSFLQVILSEKVKTIRMNVLGTSVSEGTLLWDAVHEARSRAYRVSEKDDGISKLSPEEYIQMRLIPLLNWYEANAVVVDKELKAFLALQFIYQGMAVILALVAENKLLVAIPIAIAAAIATHIANKGLMIKLLSYNKAAVSIKNNVSWWRALTAIEQANPLKYDFLVKSTEGPVALEAQATNPGTDMTTSGGGGGDGSALDINAFMADVKDNLAKDGTITFRQAWIDNHPAFFVNYCDWLKDKLEMKIRDDGIDEDGDDSKPTFDEVTDLAEEDPMFANIQLTDALHNKDVDAIVEEADAEDNDMDLDPDKSPPVDRILWDDLEFFERRSDVTEVERGRTEMEDVEEAIKALNINDWMLRHQGHATGPRGLVVMVGSTDDCNSWLDEGIIPDGLTSEQADKRMNLLFSRGVVRAAAETNSVILTSGLDLGVIGYAGRANRDRYHKGALVGVAGKGVSTWPGDVRPNRETRTDLECNHTHFILCNSALDQSGVTRFRVDVAKSMQRNGVFGGTGSLPVMVLVMNGNTHSTVMEVLQFVRIGWPICIVKGSGGAADAICKAIKTLKDDFVKDPRLVEIVMEGNLETVALNEADGANMQSMISRLFLGGDTVVPYGVCKDAWCRVAKYRDNGGHAGYWDTFYQRFQLGLGVLTTIIVAVKRQQAANITAEIDLYMELGTILSPILLSVAATVNSSFQFGVRRSVLMAAAEAIESQIYQYRSGMMDYASVPDDKLDDLLTVRITDIGNNVMATAVQVSGLKTDAIAGVVARNFRVSDEDDGLTKLAPAEYLAQRVKIEMVKFQLQSNAIEAEVRALHTVLYILGGVGCILATVGYVTYVAVAVAFSDAIQAYCETKRFTERLGFYNSAAAKTETLVSWWCSLTSIGTANPLKYAVMVKTLEDVKTVETVLINPAAGGGGGGEEPEVPGLDLGLFKSDISDHIQDNGTVKFKQTWVEKHLGFFAQFEDYLEKQGFFIANANKIKEKIIAEQGGPKPAAAIEAPPEE
eukprot:gene7412-8825_t